MTEEGFIASSWATVPIVTGGCPLTIRRAWNWVSVHAHLTRDGLLDR